MLYVIRDWLPFALVLLAYDLSRGAADLIGRPTLWHWQADADRWLFFGTMPTVWLQERLKLPQPPWWEVVISTVYMSFFILPYVVAGVLWLRNRDEWKAFVQAVRRAVLRGAGHLRAGARRAAVGRRALHRRRRRGRSVRSAVHVPLGARRARRRPARRDADHPGRRQRVDRADRRARLGQAEPALRQRAARPGPGQRQSGGRDPVAARGHDRGDRRVPVEPRAPRWRPVLVAYVLVMAFTLVYTAEHYVVDILLGWALARGRDGRDAAVHAASGETAAGQRRRFHRAPPPYRDADPCVQVDVARFHDQLHRGRATGRRCCWLRDIVRGEAMARLRIRRDTRPGTGASSTVDPLGHGTATPRTTPMPTRPQE